MESRRIVANMAANSLQEQLTAAESRISRLITAGNRLRNYTPDSNQLQAETDLFDMFEDWDEVINEMA